MTSQPDELLSALDQLTNTIYWYRARSPDLAAASAITEAIDDWLAEHSAEHHHSAPFKPAGQSNDHHPDPLGLVLQVLQAAIPALDASGARPGITLSAALTEAIEDWNAAASAEHHASAPFEMTLRPGR